MGNGEQIKFSLEKSVARVNRIVIKFYRYSVSREAKSSKSGREVCFCRSLTNASVCGVTVVSVG
jgi:hypothetical protein